VTPGQVVALGEPIATADGPEPASTTDTPSGTAPTLYVELRRHGQPINPLPWLAASDRKVSG